MFRVSILFFSLLFLLTSVNAKDDHQVGVKFGLTSIDNKDGWNLENGTFFADFLYDTPTVIDPRFDIGYISLDEDDNGGVGSLWQFAVNGVYDIEIEGCKYTRIFSPYVLAGLGYEYVPDNRASFESHPFIQVGAGANYNLTDTVDLVTEFRALQMFDDDNSDEDNEFSFLFGIKVPLFINVARGTQVVKKPIPTPVKQQRVYEPEQIVEEYIAPQVIVEQRLIESTSVVIPEDTSLSQVNTSVVEHSTIQPITTVVEPLKTFTRVKRQKLNINFESNSASIKADSQKFIKKYAQFLSDNQDIKVTIEGYTDNSGERAKNFELSKRRAEAVVNMLSRLGVEKSRLSSIGKGDLNPIADNSTAKGRAENRRIEAVIR